MQHSADCSTAWSALIHAADRPATALKYGLFPVLLQSSYLEAVHPKRVSGVLWSCQVCC